MIGLSHYLTVAAILFTIGVFGIFVNRKNIIVILMSIELILLAVNINLVAFSVYLGDVVVVVTMIIMAVIVMGMRRMRAGVAMRVVVVMVELVAAGVARMRARQGNQPGKDRADQRQENESLDHSSALLDGMI